MCIFISNHWEWAFENIYIQWHGKKYSMYNREREIMWGGQINMHSMVKNAKVIIIYSLNPARGNNTHSETPNRGLNFQDIPFPSRSFTRNVSVSQAALRWSCCKPRPVLLPGGCRAVHSDSSSLWLSSSGPVGSPGRGHLWAMVSACLQAVCVTPSKTFGFPGLQLFVTKESIYLGCNLIPKPVVRVHTVR